LFVNRYATLHRLLARISSLVRHATIVQIFAVAARRERKRDRQVPRNYERAMRDFYARARHVKKPRGSVDGEREIAKRGSENLRKARQCCDHRCAHACSNCNCTLTCDVVNLSRFRIYAPFDFVRLVRNDALIRVAFEASKPANVKMQTDASVGTEQFETRLHD